MNKIKFGIDKLQLYLLGFPHLFQSMILIYPILFLNIFTNIHKCRYLNKFSVGLLLLYFSFFSLFVRDGSVNFIFSAMSYYLGIIIFYLTFKLSDNLKIGLNYVLLFLCLILIEFIFLKYDIFIYSEFHSSRTSLSESYYRVLGPALNSSISSVILSTIFFYYLRQMVLLKAYKILNFLLAFFILFCFLLCFSITGFISFIIIFIYFLFQGVRKLNLLHLTFIKGKFGYLLATILISLFLFFFYLKYSEIRDFDNYFLEVLLLKNLDLSEFTIRDLFLGINLSDESPDNLGGDFAILRFSEHCGLFFLLPFVFYIFWVCKPSNRIFLFVALAASFHYGVIFSLTGNFFFAMVMTDSFDVES